MRDKKSIHIRVPATTANLGSGFDVLGMALSLYNEAHFIIEEERPFPQIEITAEGEGVSEMPTDSRNIIIRSMAAAADAAGGILPGGRLHLVNRIPFARGLGSSSAAIVSGVCLANRLMGYPLSEKALLRTAAEIEGHPDNVAPALLGGLTTSMMEGNEVKSRKFSDLPDWKAVVAIPDFELLTEKARAALPDGYSRKDAVHSVSAVSFLLSAFFQKDPACLRTGLNDRLHVPYRLPLIPGGKEVMEAAEKAGAYGTTISGSGPTMISFAAPDMAASVGRAMKAGFAEKGISARIEILSFDLSGACEF